MRLVFQSWGIFVSDLFKLLITVNWDILVLLLGKQRLFIYLFVVVHIIHIIFDNRFIFTVPVHTLEVSDGGRGHFQKTLWSTRLLFTTGSILVAPIELMESRFLFNVLPFL